jgi:hypothetical protein
MIEAVEYEWTTWDLETSSKYTGKPTKGIERAWDHLWQCKASFWKQEVPHAQGFSLSGSIDGSLGIPESNLGLLNKSVDQNWLHTPLELGGGVTALFEGFHQIHCLVSRLMIY